MFIVLKVTFFSNVNLFNVALYNMYHLYHTFYNLLQQVFFYLYINYFLILNFFFSYIFIIKSINYNYLIMSKLVKETKLLVIMNFVTVLNILEIPLYGYNFYQVET